MGNAYQRRGKWDASDEDLIVYSISTCTHMFLVHKLFIQLDATILANETEMWLNVEVLPLAF